MSRKERLLALIEYYGAGKPGNFARLLGVAPSTISSWLARETMDLELIYAKCENLSADWLLGNDCPMLKNENVEQKDDILLKGIMGLLAKQHDKIVEQAKEIGKLEQIAKNTMQA